MLTPNEWFHKMKIQICIYDKYAFVSAFLMAMLTHMRIFIQDIPNHDGMDGLYFDQNMITSGRWFLTVVCGISSDYTLPWIIGVLSCLYLAIAAVFLSRFLALRESYSVFIVSGLLVTYPVLASNFAYMFTADGYMCSLMLAIIAVYLVEKYSYGFILGGVFLAFSMGIYQSYLAVAMVLSLYAVVRFWIIQVQPKLRWIITGKYIGFGVIGAILYYVLLQVLLLVQATQLSGYQGIGGEYQTSALDIGKGIYMDFFVHTLKGNILMSNTTSGVIIVTLMFLASISLIGIIRKNKCYKDPWFDLVLVSAVLLLPVCFNVTLLLSPNVTYHSLMRIQWIFIPICIIAICDNYLKTISRQSIKAMTQWACLVMGAILIVQYAIVCNIGYFNLEKKYEKTYAYCLRLLDRMEETAGYYHGMPVAMIGVVGDEYLPSTDLTVSVTDSLLNVNGDYLFYTAENYRMFMKYYFGVSIELVDINEIPDIIQSEAYLALDTFPKEHAMVVVDDVLYIKTEN